MSVSTGRIAVAAAATVGIALIAIWSVSRHGITDPFAPCRTGNVAAGVAGIGGPFELTDENGKAVSDKDVLTKPALIYFGFTFCQDVCPTDVSRNAQAVDILEEQGHDVTPVFISVDPHRDTPEVLKEWTDNIHPRLLGLTGTDAQLKTVTKAYRVYYQAPENPTDEYYEVDHSVQTFLMLPGVGFAEFFTSEVPADEVAKRAACFLDAASLN